MEVRTAGDVAGEPQRRERPVTNSHAHRRAASDEIPHQAAREPHDIWKAEKTQEGGIRESDASDVVAQVVLEQLHVLAFQLFDPLPFVGRQPGSVPGVSLGLTHPPPQGLARAP